MSVRRAGISQFFEMLAHHAFNRPAKPIYFKDRTVELCHEFATKRLGIDGRKMHYIEEWWEGGGNSGPCMEVILEGVEIATVGLYAEHGNTRGPSTYGHEGRGYWLWPREEFDVVIAGHAIGI